MGAAVSYAVREVVDARGGAAVSYAVREVVDARGAVRRRDEVALQVRNTLYVAGEAFLDEKAPGDRGVPSADVRRCR